MRRGNKWWFLHYPLKIDICDGILWGKIRINPLLEVLWLFISEVLTKYSKNFLSLQNLGNNYLAEVRFSFDLSRLTDLFFFLSCSTWFIVIMQFRRRKCRSKLYVIWNLVEFSTFFFVICWNIGFTSYVQYVSGECILIIDIWIEFFNEKCCNFFSSDF